MSRTDSTSYVRRAQIVSLSLTELMLLLVFMAIAFSFLAKEEGLREVPRVQAQLNDALSKIESLNTKNAVLEKNLKTMTDKAERLERFLERIGVDSTTLTPHGNTISFDPTHTYVLSTTGGKAPGRPLCALKSVYLISFELLPDERISGSPTWDPVVDKSVADLAGVSVLASGQPLSISTFETAARQLQNDSVLRRSGCVFAAKATRKTNDADAFDAELSSVERFFYVRHD